jgi:hypothetical protein
MSKTLFIIGVIICIIVLYLWNTQSALQSESFTPNITGDGNMPMSHLYPEDIPSDIDQDSEYGSIPRRYASDEPIDEPIVDEENQNIQNNNSIRKKYITRETTTHGNYKKLNYADGIRGDANMSDELEHNFNSSNELIQDDYMDNDKYNGYDESEGKYASYNNSGKKSNKYKLDEIFNSDNFLPKYKRDDWFEVLPEAISVKNRHLINVSKPIGINTIGTSLRNPSWDIRGSPACPKFVVAPWMQSTIEPDTNLKSLC